MDIQSLYFPLWGNTNPYIWEVTYTLKQHAKHSFPLSLFVSAGKKVFLRFKKNSILMFQVSKKVTVLCFFYLILHAASWQPMSWLCVYCPCVYGTVSVWYPQGTCCCDRLLTWAAFEDNVQIVIWKLPFLSLCHANNAARQSKVGCRLQTRADAISLHSMVQAAQRIHLPLEVWRQEAEYRLCDNEDLSRIELPACY